MNLDTSWGLWPYLSNFRSDRIQLLLDTGFLGFDEKGKICYLIGFLHDYNSDDDLH